MPAGLCARSASIRIISCSADSDSGVAARAENANDCSAGSNEELCGHGTCVNQGNSYKCLCEQVCYRVTLVVLDLAWVDLEFE